MTGLEKFRFAVRVSKYIERNLEVLARVVEGTENRNAIFNNLMVDLKKLFPEDDPDTLAQALITEQCRVEYLKMMYAKKPMSVGGRD